MCVGGVIGKELGRAGTMSILNNTVYYKRFFLIKRGQQPGLNLLLEKQ